jgi:hypothetical protein
MSRLLAFFAQRERTVKVMGADDPIERARLPEREDNDIMTINDSKYWEPERN